MALATPWPRRLDQPTGAAVRGQDIPMRLALALVTELVPEVLRMGLVLAIARLPAREAVSKEADLSCLATPLPSASHTAEVGLGYDSA